MRGLFRQRFVAVAAGSVMLVGLGSAGAVAGGLTGSEDIKDQSIAKVDIGKAAVGGSEIKKGSIKEKKLSDALREKINQLPLQGEPGPAGPVGPAGPAGPAGPSGGGADVLGALVDSTSYDGPSLALESSGMPGLFGDMVKLGELNLPAGTHLLSANVAAKGATIEFFDPSGLVFAIGDTIVGMDVNIFPLSNSTQAVSLAHPSLVDVYGQFPAPVDAESDYDVWFRAAAVRVSQQADPELLAGDGIGPIVPPATAQQLLSTDGKSSQ